MFAFLDTSWVIALAVVGFFVLDIVLITLFAVMALKRQKHEPAAPPVPRVTLPKKRSRMASVLIALAVTLFWSGITMAFDIPVAGAAVSQIQSYGYLAVEGEILRCARQEKPTDEGTSYNVDVVYKYRVGGLDYTGNVIRPSALTERSESSVDEFVTAHPPASRVTVYYNPDDPTEAVLRQGLSGSTLFIALFLLPFNLIMVGFWVVTLIITLFGEQAAYRMFSRVKIWKREDQVRVRLPPTTPLLAGFATVAVASIVCAMFAACCTSATLTVMTVAWTVVLSLGFLAYGLNLRRALSGSIDLVIDHRQMTLTLPQTYGRKESLVLPLGDVLTIDVTAVEKKDSDGTSIVHVLEVRWRDVGGRVNADKLTESSDQEYGQWLAEQLRLEAGLSALASAPN